MNLFPEASNKIILRPYQGEAVSAAYEHLRTKNNNPCIVIPTAGGKTPVMAQICKDVVQAWNGRILILAHVKELLEQSYEALIAMAPDLDVGLFSAGLGRRDMCHPVTVAGIQSIYKRASEFDPWNIILIDECFVGHTPISTPRGWMAIDTISPGDEVYCASGIGVVTGTSMRYVDSLVKLEFDDGCHLVCTPNHPFFTTTGWEQAGTMERGTIVFGQQGVSSLRNGLSSASMARQGHQGTPVEQASVLLAILCQEDEEPNAQIRYSREGFQDAETDWSSSPSSRRKWPTDTHRAGKAAGDARRRLGAGVCDFYGRKASKGDGTSDTLQDRSGQRAYENLHRGRRTFSHIAGSSGTGSAKNIFPDCARLVRVSHLQPGSRVLVYNLQVSGHPSYYAGGKLVHNCHMIPNDGEGMYRTFLQDCVAKNPTARLVGLTATPYRMSSGMICAPECLLNEVCYEVGVKNLIGQGYLCPLRSRQGKQKVDRSKLGMRGGEFIASETQDLMNQDHLVNSACQEIILHTQDRKGVLIFCSGVEHAEHVVKTLGQMGQECGLITGNTLDFDRADTIKRFKAGKLKYLANINVLTTGFNAPITDCIVLLRPTESPGLYYQMVGRGFRLCEGKEYCLVLDFAGNVARHGPIDVIEAGDHRTPGMGQAPVKECSQCEMTVMAGCATCPYCGFEFPAMLDRNGPKHAVAPDVAPILSGEILDSDSEVTFTEYEVWVKKVPEGQPPKPPTMRVKYHLGMFSQQSEWVCIEHDGFAGRKAAQWWAARSNVQMPDTVEEAVRLCKAGAIAKTNKITIRHVSGQKFDEILRYDIGEKPDADAAIAKAQQTLKIDEECKGGLKTGIDFSKLISDPDDPPPSPFGDLAEEGRLSSLAGSREDLIGGLEGILGLTAPDLSDDVPF